MKKKYTLIGFILEKKLLSIAFLAATVILSVAAPLKSFAGIEGDFRRSPGAVHLVNVVQQNGSAALYVFGAGDRIGEPYFRIFQQGYLYQDVHQEHRTDT